MPLVSNLFRDNARLGACLTDHPAHVTPGSFGEHVHLIQVALMDIDGLTIDPGEIKTQRYGPSTAAAVLAYKRKRKIVNRAYQQSEDNIVGRMTIAALDKDMLDRQYVPLPAGRKPCGRVL
jgi:peptidoglycan hydrolase-like protein with peptidoglycan-binding domain